MARTLCRAVLPMLKNFSAKFAAKRPVCGSGGGMRRPGLWVGLCRKLVCSLWQLFALAALLLFVYILRQPGAYLLIVLFLQVLGLMIWLQSRRF